MPKLPIALAPLALLVTLGCATSQTSAAPPAGRSGKDSDQAAKSEKKAAELGQARLQLQLAELEAGFAATAAEETVVAAQRELELAELELARFREYERPSELAQAQLSLDRATHSRLQDEQELQQMEEMYAAETNLDSTGERTRDIVLERHRKALEFSTRQLELTRDRTEDLRARVLPRKEHELEVKLADARIARRKAEEKQRKGALEAELSLSKARARVRELERGAEGDGTALEEGDR